jgi:hypothetical protein
MTIYSMVAIICGMATLFLQVVLAIICKDRFIYMIKIAPLAYFLSVLFLWLILWISGIPLDAKII